MTGVTFNNLEDDAFAFPVIRYFTPFSEEHQPRMKLQKLPG